MHRCVPKVNVRYIAPTQTRFGIVASYAATSPQNQEKNMGYICFVFFASLAAKHWSHLASDLSLLAAVLNVHAGYLFTLRPIPVETETLRAPRFCRSSCASFMCSKL